MVTGWLVTFAGYHSNVISLFLFTLYVKDKNIPLLMTVFNKVYHSLNSYDMIITYNFHSNTFTRKKVIKKHSIHLKGYWDKK